MTKKEVEEFKDELKNLLLKSADEQITVAKGMLQEALDAVKDDTKSTAGDKHETSRAMAQIEQEKSAKLLHKAQNLKRLLVALPTSKAVKVEMGAIVKTNRSCFYLSQAIGKIEFKKEVYFCISPSAPIAQAMLNKKKSDKVVFNGVTQEILEIL